MVDVVLESLCYGVRCRRLRGEEQRRVTRYYQSYPSQPLSIEFFSLGLGCILCYTVSANEEDRRRSQLANRVITWLERLLVL